MVFNLYDIAFNKFTNNPINFKCIQLFNWWIIYMIKVNHKEGKIVSSYLTGKFKRSDSSFKGRRVFRMSSGLLLKSLTIYSVTIYIVSVSAMQADECISLVRLSLRGCIRDKNDQKESQNNYLIRDQTSYHWSGPVQGSPSCKPWKPEDALLSSSLLRIRARSTNPIPRTTRGSRPRSRGCRERERERITHPARKMSLFLSLLFRRISTSKAD